MTMDAFIALWAKLQSHTRIMVLRKFGFRIPSGVSSVYKLRPREDWVKHQANDLQSGCARANIEIIMESTYSFPWNKRGHSPLSPYVICRDNVVIVHAPGVDMMGTWRLHH